MRDEPPERATDVNIPAFSPSRRGPPLASRAPIFATALTWGSARKASLHPRLYAYPCSAGLDQHLVSIARDNR
jgi:hypothetical protein